MNCRKPIYHLKFKSYFTATKKKEIKREKKNTETLCGEI